MLVPQMLLFLTGKKSYIIKFIILNYLYTTIILLIPYFIVFNIAYNLVFNLVIEFSGGKHLEV